MPEQFWTGLDKTEQDQTELKQTRQNWTGSEITSILAILTEWQMQPAKKTKWQIKQCIKGP